MFLPFGSYSLCVVGLLMLFMVPEVSSRRYKGFNDVQEMPLARSDVTAITFDGSLFSDGNGPRIYLVGGCVADQICPPGEFCYCPEITNRTHYYIPKLDQWYEASNAPRARSRYGAVVYDGKMFVIGGRDSSDGLLTAIDVYDPVTDLWSTSGAWNNAPSDHGMFVEGESLYVVGGYDASYAPLATLTRIDPTTFTTAPLANMSVGRGDIGTVSLQDKHGEHYHYVIGGFASDICSPLADVEVYSVADDEWSSRAPVDLARGDLAVGVIDASMFVIAGETKAEDCNAEAFIPGTSIPVNDVERFDVNDLINVNGDGLWNREEDIPENRFRFVGASYGAKDIIYLFGGQSRLVTPDAGNPYYPVLNTTMLYVPKSVADSYDKLDDGEVAGIVIGVVAGCCIIGASVIAVLTYRKYRGYTSTTDEPPETAPPQIAKNAEVEVITFDDV